MEERKLRIRCTAIPPQKPPYKEWVRMMGISEGAYQNGDGRMRAMEIMRGVGLKSEPTVLDELKVAVRALWNTESTN